MAEAVHLAPYGVRVTQNQPFVLRCLCQPVQGCLCGSTNSSALHLSVLSLNEAEDQVQNVCDILKRLIKFCFKAAAPETCQLLSRSR